MSRKVCPFCAIAGGEATASVVADHGAVLAFIDPRQAVAGHVLTIRRRHMPDISALTAAQASAVMHGCGVRGRSVELHC